MKASELMIGDWVQDITPCVIDAISNEDICTYRNVDGYITANPSNLKPIPLTAEILEKNGWNKWCEHSTIVRSISVLVEYNTNLCIQEIDGQDTMFVQLSHCGAGSFEFRKHLKYVHELQHTFRLVGLNELADNFKV